MMAVRECVRAFARVRARANVRARGSCAETCHAIDNSYLAANLVRQFIMV